MAASKQEFYSDLNLSFIPHPVTGAVTRKTNADAVRQSIKSLILTDRYERPFKPDIGCNIRGYLFELWSPMTKQMMENAVEETIRIYEPRAQLIKVIVEDRPDFNALTVSIAFRVINDPTPVVLDVILERVR